MADLKVTFDPITGAFDFQLCHGTVVADDGLRTAVIISLFTDARARDDDEIPDGSNDRRGWWGAKLLYGDSIIMGSRRWLLGREKQLDSVLRKLEEYDGEALKWLVDEGIASRVEVIAEHDGPERWLETIRIYKIGEISPWEFSWEFERSGRQSCAQKFEQPPVVVVYPPIDENSISLVLHSYAALINAAPLGASGLAPTQLSLHSYAVLSQALQIGDVALQPARIGLDSYNALISANTIGDVELQPANIGLDSYNALIAGAALGDGPLQPATANLHSYNALIQGAAVGNAALNPSSLTIDSYSTLIGAA